MISNFIKRFVRLVPFELVLNNITCVINDGSDTSCEALLGSANSAQCINDIAFNYTFTNIGLSCVEVMEISASLGPLRDNLLDFNNIYGYQEREMCPGENWTIPDTRSSVNLCTFTEIPWDILLEFDEFYGRRTNLTFEYQWIPILETSAPVVAPSDSPSITLSNLPTNVQSNSPTASPTINTCNDCTLSGFISGGMCENIVQFLLSSISFL